MHPASVISSYATAGVSFVIQTPPMNFSSAVANTMASWAAWVAGGGRARLSRAGRSTAAINFKR